MKSLKVLTINHRLALVALILLLGLFALSTWTAGIWAQSPIPHAVQEGDDCLSCHQSGVAGAPRLAWDHLGRDNEECLICHRSSGALAGEIPHPVAGRDDCLSCHRQGVGDTPRLTGNHVDYASEECGHCHLPSAAALAPTPIPTLITIPSPAPGVAPGTANTCIACHQLIFADDKHALFTGQPLSDPQAGATLFAQLCARCHGENGQKAVGDEGRVINSEAYWGAHDDAAILQAIAAGAQGQMPAFAQAYGGPLAWEAVLNLAAFVRSWGSVATPAVESVTYAGAIGPLLTERCGMCHGGVAGLTVTDYQSLMAGAASGPVIAPGDPDGSRIVQVQRGQHYAQLSEAELQLLIRWIADGAAEQ